MVRMASNDRLCTVELLQQHHAGEHMRPGHRAEREEEVGAPADTLVKTVGTADDEGCAAPLREAFGQEGAAQILAALVERDERHTGGKGGEEELGLPWTLVGKVLSLLYLAQGRGAGEAREVMVLQFLERPGLQAPDRRNMEPQPGLQTVAAAWTRVGLR